MAARAKDLKVPRVLGLQNPIHFWRCGKLGHYGQHCRSIAIVGDGETGGDDWTWNAQQWDAQQPEPEAGSTIGGLWLCSLGGQANASNPHLRTVTFGVDSGAEETVTSRDTASDTPRERRPKNAVRGCTGRPVEDMGDKF